MKIIAGLGNPEKKYELTRHNVGFRLLDKLVKSQGQSWEKNKNFNSEVLSLNHELLVKPLTFMNNSGVAISRIMHYYKLLPKHLGLLAIKNSDVSGVLTIIHDDIDIELGKYKISINSRSAGHKGIDSIISHIRTKNFKRIRIGINGPKDKSFPTKNYVLSKFPENEIKIVDKVIDEIIDKEL